MTPWHAKGRKKRQNRATPRPLFLELARRYSRGGFTLDVCAEAWNAKVARYFDRKVDGLAQSWRNLDGSPARCWCNPPYENIEAWMRKAWLEVQTGAAELVVLLVPARTDQPWYHEIAEPFGTIIPIRGRVEYPTKHSRGRAQGAFESSIVVIFDRPIIAADFREREAA